ncbi:MAG: type IV pilin protein [Burkholderiales bacterium]
MKTHASLQNTHARGFTLVELMIAVAIIAFLIGIAYPSYRDHLVKSRRAEAKAALLKAAQLQERIYITGDPAVANSIALYASNNRLPTLFGLAAGATVYSGEDPTVATSPYRIQVDAPTAQCALNSCFVLRAVRNGTFTDPKCGDFTLSSTGVRGVANATDTAAQCW